MQIKITMQYDIPEEDQDSESDTGLTEDAFYKLHTSLADAGMDDITITKKN